MVQFLDWEGLRGRGLTGDLDSIFTTWMDWNGLEWAVMAFNGYFIPTHSNPVDITIKITPYVIATHSNSFQPIPTHSNSFQPIQILLIFLSKSPFMSFQLIPIHSDPFWFIPTHSDSFQFIPIESKSPYKPLPLSPSHSRNSTWKNKYHFFLKISSKFIQVVIRALP